MEGLLLLGEGCRDGVDDDGPSLVVFSALWASLLGGMFGLKIRLGRATTGAGGVIVFLGEEIPLDKDKEERLRSRGP